MALIVEDGSGVANADTYWSVANISTYLAKVGRTTWASLSTANMESATLRAMNYIEAKPWKGIKTDQSYSLEWPRAQVTDRDGRAIATNTIPENLKKALAEATYRESADPFSLQEDLARGGKIKRKKVDVLDTEYFEGAPAATTVTVINGLLIGLLASTGTIEVYRG